MWEECCRDEVLFLRDFGIFTKYWPALTLSLVAKSVVGVFSHPNYLNWTRAVIGEPVTCIDIER